MLDSVPEQYRGVMKVIVVVCVLYVLWMLYTKHCKKNGAVMEPSEKTVKFEDSSGSNDIVMYGKDSCPWCKRQKKELGDKWSTVKYVNCQDQPGACEEEKINALPTWVINGKRSEGFMKKETFEKKCEAKSA